MEELANLMKAAKEMGPTLFCLCGWVVTVIYHIRHVIQQRKDERLLLEKTIVALEASNSVGRDCVHVMGELKTSTDKNTEATVKHMAFLQGRDSRGT